MLELHPRTRFCSCTEPIHWKCTVPLAYMIFPGTLRITCLWMPFHRTCSSQVSGSCGDGHTTLICMVTRVEQGALGEDPPWRLPTLTWLQRLSLVVYLDKSTIFSFILRFSYVLRSKIDKLTTTIPYLACQLTVSKSTSRVPRGTPIRDTTQGCMSFARLSKGIGCRQYGLDRFRPPSG